IEAGAFAEFPVTGGTIDAGVAWAGIGRNQHQAQFGGQALGAGLDGEGFLVAGQSGKEIQDGTPAFVCRWRHEDGEAHGAAGGGGRVLVEALDAAVAALFGKDLDAHRGTQKSRLDMRRRTCATRSASSTRLKACTSVLRPRSSPYLRSRRMSSRNASSADGASPSTSRRTPSRCRAWWSSGSRCRRASSSATDGASPASCTNSSVLA